MKLYDQLALSASFLLSVNSVAAQKASTPCQSVSSMSVAFTSMFPQATHALVPAQAAADCLKSVPIDKAEDLALIDELKLFINWQSSLAYIDNPPSGDKSGRVPTLQTIAKIRNDLQNDKYKDEYSLQFDLATVMVRSYDFHFNWIPDITQVFQFRRGNVGRGLLDEFAVVSVSSDGKALPKLYNYYDVIVGSQQGWTASPISQINNQSGVDYITTWSLNQPYHEDHGRYNKLFPSQPEISLGGTLNQFGSGYIPDGDYTYVTHENGSSFKYINSAIIPLKAFDGVVDGQTFFNKFCNQGPPGDSNTNSKRSIKRSLKQKLEDLEIQKRNPTKVKRASSSAAPSPTGYPTPVVYHSEGVVGGYYLNGSGYSDVAVLSLTSFEPTDKAVVEFQNNVGTFLQQAVQAGKKKLIVDIRDNGGGLVYMGFDVFKQLFPSMDPYGASQMRANDAFDKTGQAMDAYFQANDITYAKALADYEAKGVNSTLAATWQSIFNWRLPLTTQNKNFTSWKEYFGPNKRYNDQWTTVSRKDLNNPFTEDLGTDVTGYGTRIKNLNTKQPFDAANIVMLNDGGCGSTCAVFSEFMKTQGNVQNIVVGGLPRTGPMQGVTGAKGSQVIDYVEVAKQATIAYNLMPKQQAALNKTELGQLVFAERPLYRSAWTDDGDIMSRINLRDNIRMNDTAVTPLDFVYEAADCRLFYTSDMIQNVQNVWKKVADTKWGSNPNSLCVQDSTGDPSSLSGGAKPWLGNPANAGQRANNSDSSSDAVRMSPAWASTVVVAGLVQLLM